MPKVTYKDHQGTSKTIEVESGLSVMEGAIQKDIPGIDADCGGSMACATCHVYVDDKWLEKIPKAEDAEIDMIDMAFEPKKNSRLSCQLVVSDELESLVITSRTVYVDEDMLSKFILIFFVINFGTKKNFCFNVKALFFLRSLNLIFKEEIFLAKS